MITCNFEDGNLAHPGLRHVVADCLVVREGKILLVQRNGKLLEGGKWGLAGGFVDRDETTSEAAKREIQEETGWRVGDAQLFRIVDNPNRPKEDRQNIAFVFICQATRKVGEGDWESDDLEWFELGNLPAKEQMAFDHNDHIELYRQYLAKPFALPLLG